MPSSDFVFFSDLAEVAKKDNAVVVQVPRGLRSKKKLLGALAQRLYLPGYFGGNWDALEECLRDLSWLPEGKGVVIVHPDVPFGSGANRPTYLSILHEATAHWKANKKRSFSAAFPKSTENEVNQVG